MDEIEINEPEDVSPAPDIARPQKILEDMKKEGISGAVIRKDGILIHSTFAITDTGASILSNVANIPDALLKRIKDEAKETEIAFGNLIMLIIPVHDYYFVGAMKSRDQKTTVRKYAKQAKSVL
jgi:hypothetical protein